MPKTTSARPKRRIALSALVAGGAASLLLALSMSPTVAAFTASIQNAASVGTGALVMEQFAAGQPICKSSDGDGIKTNKATCSTLDTWGGSTALVPGETVGVDIEFKNAGTITASTFTLAAGTCTQSPTTTPNDKPSFHGDAKDLCSKLKVVIRAGSTVLFEGSPDKLATATQPTPLSILTALKRGPLAAGSSVSLNVSVTLPETADDNDYAGLKASQSLTWIFNS